MSNLRVIAIIAARNEADILHQVLEDLTTQNVHAYVIDDGSTDGTAEVVGRLLDRGVIGFEKRPDTGIFEWADILKRKEQLALELDADWFLHQDADEFHESPFPGLDLRSAIEHVDRMGYSAIDFKLLNFRPTSSQPDSSADVRRALRFYELPDYWDVTQVKAWKKSDVRVDLRTSGGHSADFPTRLVYPIQFLKRHYPIRSQDHGEQKVFADRKPRFATDERNHGWHVQYDQYAPGASFVRDPSTLTEYDGRAMAVELMTTTRDASRLASAELTIQRLSEEQERAYATQARTDAALASASLELEEERRLRAADAIGAAAEFETRRREHAGAMAGLSERLESQRREQAETTGRLTEELEATRADRATATDARRLAESEQRRLELGLEVLAAELQAVYRSRSWKLTGPLRVILGWLQRITRP
ncbi:MAG TPA: glycosyltransferase family 2 protein [Vicinamibacterales bacterium]|nr:glycosyltransferase family 2 protein [Vicinamibacterales bacterium]